MRNVLFLNTTEKRLQIAVSKDKEVKRYVGSDEAKRHNAALLPVLDGLLNELNICVKDLTDIVCVSGPGSFTGIRAGASFANALKRSTGANLYAPTSLEIVGEGDRVVALDCKHGNYYVLIEENSEIRYAEMTEAELRGVALPRYDVTDDTLSELIAYGTRLVSEGKASTDAVRPFYLKKSSAEREAGI